MHLLNVSSLWRSIFTFRKKSTSYKSSRRDFYEGRNFLSHNARIADLFQSTTHNQVKVDKPIKCYGLEFGTSFKVARKRLGKPNYMTQGKSISGVKSIFYRITINGAKCILQFHFLENEFFLGVIEITNAFSEQGNKIVDLVRSKYQITDINWHGAIKDNQNNTIKIGNDMIKRITYTSGDTSIRENLIGQLARIEIQKYPHHKSSLVLEMI